MRVASTEWYLIISKAHKAEWVCRQLASRVPEIFHPLLRRTGQRGGARVTTLQPLFPGYIFCRCDLEKDYVEIMYTPGVRGLVAAGNEPISVPLEIIEALKLRCPGGVAQVPRTSLRGGEKVEVVAGPLRGLSGLFEHYVSGRERVEIMLAIVRQGGVRVTLRAGDIAPANR